MIVKAEIYTKDMCPSCVKAKQLLDQLHIPYVEYKISSGFGESPPKPNQFYITKADLLQKLPSAKTVPQIWVDGRHIGGCDDLYAAHTKGELKS
jgi:glutaredoxin 3